MTPWQKHVEAWKDCQRCPLSQQRGRICLARGTLPCDILFIGEAPGVSEDALGQPFVGPAGFHLDGIIDRALEPWIKPITQGLSYNSVTVAFTNVVACFPREAKLRGDNEPERGEILECRPRLIEFVNIAKPRLIVRVGVLASQYVPFCDDLPVVDITHPAAIVRMPLAQQHMASQKCAVQIRNAWESVVESGIKEFKQWGKKYAEVQSRKQELRQTYSDAEQGNYWEPGTDDESIPF